MTPMSRNKAVGEAGDMDEFNETLEQLELLIGKENARKVVTFFEGANIYFPKSIGLQEQHNQIFAELRSGSTYQDVAQKYGYTKSYIRKIEHKKYDERKARRGTMKARQIDMTNERVSEPVRLAPREIKIFEQGDLFYE
jgi:hypothetical protein